jgi:N-acetylneuraminic acid mutarotase
MKQLLYHLILLLTLISVSCLSKKDPVPTGLSATSLDNVGILGHIVGGVENQTTRDEILQFKKNKLSRIGQLQFARYHHTETLLPDGKILIIGGYHRDAGGAPLREIEEIDLHKGTSELVAFLNTARGGHTATLLKDGRILTMKESRSNFEAILIPTGQIILIGGHGSNMKSIEKFNPLTNSFSRAGYLHQGRFIHKCILLNNGKILITGGYDNVDSLNEAELYDIKTQGSKKLTPMNVDRDGHRLIKISDGRIIVIGGADMGVMSTMTEVFDPVTNKFSPGPELDFGVEGHTAHLLSNDQILIFGGTSEAPWFYIDLNKAILSK